jgi:hypothetical protein
MIRKIMILTLIILVGYIFYAQFLADSLEPFFKKNLGESTLYEVKVPKTIVE